MKCTKKYIYEDFIEDLISLKILLNEALNINSGGCCLFTYYITKYCDKYEIPYDIIIFNDKHWKISKKDFIESVKNRKNINKESFKHITLRIKNNVNIISDSKMVFKRVIKNLNSEDIKFIYDNELNWNSFYNTKYNKLVSEKIKNCFEYWFENKKYDNSENENNKILNKLIKENKYKEIQNLIFKYSIKKEEYFKFYGEDKTLNI